MPAMEIRIFEVPRRATACIALLPFLLVVSLLFRSQPQSYRPADMCDLGSAAASDDGNDISSLNTSKCGKRYVEAPYLDNGCARMPSQALSSVASARALRNRWQFFVELQF